MKQKLFLSAVMVLLLLTFLSGCNRSAQEETSQTDVKQDPIEEKLKANPALSRSGALIVASEEIDGGFNPLFPASDTTHWIVDLVFDPLFYYGADGNLENGLAESLEQQENRLIYIMTLRPGIEFHNGADLTAKDVVFTYQTLLNPSYDGAYKSAVTNLEKVESAVDGTVTFTFRSDDRMNERAFTVPILSYDHYRFSDWQAFVNNDAVPVGTGAFKFDNYTENDSIILIKNTGYWQKPPMITGIVIREMSEAVASKAFEEGRIDLYSMTPSRASSSGVRTLDYSGIIVQSDDVITMIGVNTLSPVLSDYNVRKALLIGMNRENFVTTEWEGYASVVDTITTSLIEAQLGNQDSRFKYDAEEAANLLEASGWRDSDDDGIREKNKVKLSLEWQVFADVDWSYNLAEMAAAEWRKLGIEVNLEFCDYEKMMADLEAGDIPDLWNFAWRMDNDANPAVLFGNGEPNYNYTGYNDGVANQIFQSMRTAYTSFEFEELIDQWHILQSDSLAYLPIARPYSVWVYNTRLKNFGFREGGDWTDFVNTLELEVLQ